MRHIEAGRWDEVGAMLLSSPEKLRKAGAELPLLIEENWSFGSGIAQYAQ